jgi:hypothetical protein
MIQLQQVWFLSHLSTLVCCLINQFTKQAYYPCLLSILVSYSIIYYKTHQFKLVFFTDENALYLWLCIFWLLQKPFSFALVPYAAYSVFHVAREFKQYPIALRILNYQPQGKCKSIHQIRYFRSGLSSFRISFCFSMGIILFIPFICRLCSIRLHLLLYAYFSKDLNLKSHCFG